MTEIKTEPVRCRKGRCEYKHKDPLDECLDCDLAEQIEHDLLNCEIKGC